MNLSEFKAWFEGFTEQMDGPPTTKQWKRIRAKVKGIDDVATPLVVFQDRWARRYPHWEWTFMPRREDYSTLCSVGTSTKTLAGAQQQIDYDANTAFAELGRAEANSMSAN